MLPGAACSEGASVLASSRAFTCRSSLELPRSPYDLEQGPVYWGVGPP